MDKNRIIRLIMLIIALGCFGYLGVYYFMFNSSQTQVSTLSGIKEKGDTVVVYERDPVTKHIILNTEDRVISKYKDLYSKNKNLIGWLKIDDTNIDYPVVKSVNGDGSFYLDHNFDGKDDKNGTLFMDDFCNPEKPSDNLIIYGHNMKSGLMFGSLTSYKSKSFYEKHKRVKFDTIFKEGVYEVVFAFPSKVYDQSEITFKYYQFIEPNSKEEFDSGINEMRNLSLYDTEASVEYGDKLLTLSTCDYDEANGRFVVVCKRVN